MFILALQQKGKMSSEFRFSNIEMSFEHCFRQIVPPGVRHLLVTFLIIRHTLSDPKMSEDTGAEVSSCCASCGMEEIDVIKLKECDDCDLARYCSNECQENHKSEHKEACKKREAELRDELLFKQPESSHLGDCPICFFPLSIDRKQSRMLTCCLKYICDGCYHANGKREFYGRLQLKCVFCRTDLPKTEVEKNERMMKRVNANDPVAMCYMGTKRYHEGNYKAAFEYLTKAVALGEIHAHHNLSIMYREGKGVEKNEKKELHHLTEAAIAGHPDARHNLALLEEKNGRLNRSVKHFIISAKLGNNVSLKCVTRLYKAGFVRKDDFEAALRGYQAAIVATKNPQRDEAYAFFTKWREG